MKLIFIRHGQTDYNKKGMLMGQDFDIPLNDVGRGQVEVAMAALPHGIGSIVSSPLKRAAETADIINRVLAVPISYDDRLKEMKYGSLAGKTWLEIEAMTNNPDIRKEDIDITFDYRPYGGEWAEDFKARVGDFVADARERFSGTVLVTAHGGVIDAMHSLYLQIKRSEADNASLHIFDFV